MKIRTVKRKHRPTWKRLLLSGIVVLCLLSAAGSALGDDKVLTAKNAAEEDSWETRDPFRPFIEVLAEEEVKKKEKEQKPVSVVSLSPLERYGVEEFNLVGIVISSGSKNMAMVEDSQGKAYPVFRGTKIGMNEGVVRTIKADGVEIIEKKKDMSGKKRNHRLILKLTDKGNEEKP